MNFERQKDTIITWYDDEKGKEIALSFQDVEDTKKMLFVLIVTSHREILLTIQGKDTVEVIENEESIDEEPLPPPALDNLSNIGEEFSAASLCFPSKRIRLTQYCLKDSVFYLPGNKT